MMITDIFRTNGHKIIETRLEHYVGNIRSAPDAL